MREVLVMDGARVTGPHPRRIVKVCRFGKRDMDDDGLFASVKPVLDRIKVKTVHGVRVEGFIYDDSPKYCKLECVQFRGDYNVEVAIFEDESEEGGE